MRLPRRWQSSYCLSILGFRDNCWGKKQSWKRLAMQLKRLECENDREGECAVKPNDGETEKVLLLNAQKKVLRREKAREMKIPKGWRSWRVVRVGCVRALLIFNSDWSTQLQVWQCSTIATLILQ